jgi:hypothetical protein
MLKKSKQPTVLIFETFHSLSGVSFVTFLVADYKKS